MGTVSALGEEVLSKLVGSLEGNQTLFESRNIPGAVLRISGNYFGRVCSTFFLFSEGVSLWH
jgi:hypothetical protein